MTQPGLLQQWVVVAAAALLLIMFALLAQRHMRALLRCDESKAGVWRRLDGSEWTFFFLKWPPGRMAAGL